MLRKRFKTHFWKMNLSKIQFLLHRLTLFGLMFEFWHNRFSSLSFDPYSCWTRWTSNPSLHCPTNQSGQTNSNKLISQIDISIQNKNNQSNTFQLNVQFAMEIPFDANIHILAPGPHFWYLLQCVQIKHLFCIRQ